MDRTKSTSLAAKIIFLVFFGFTIGWLPATIARYVYPPQKKYRYNAENES